MTKQFKIMINGELQPQGIDFTVMGLDYDASDFLNWCMQNRDNLEFLKFCKTLDRASASAVIHFDHLKIIKRIDDAIIHNRT